MKCPACGSENIAGVDRCENCMEPFRNLDVPRAKEGLQAHIMLDPVRGVFSPDPAAVSVNDSAAAAVETMCGRRAGCVLVMDGEKMVGILSEVDLLFKLDSPNADLSRIKASEIMTADPESVQEDTTMAYALHLMSIGGYRHLPVLRDGRLVGILSIKDLLRYLGQQLL